jgi:hypothetical protein
MLIVPELLLTTGPLNAGTSVGIPNAQLATPEIVFGTFDQNPASGNQDEEYIELVNTTQTAVDLSGWRLTGGVEHTFAPGTVIVAGGSLYVTPDITAFRLRATGPSGGQGLFVQGNYNGHLNNFGEQVDLVTGTGTPIASMVTENAPTDAQQFLRISELMYHPSDPTQDEIDAGFDNSEDFEFIELMNTSTTVSLDTGGIALTDGVQLALPAVTLTPGERVVLVRNQAAFEMRYGTSIAVLAQYGSAVPEDDQAFSNGGERVKIDDVDGNTILQFTYEDGSAPDEADWPAEADGSGFSLVIVDTGGSRDSWDVGTSWRSSALVGGSPGQADPTPLAADFNGDGTVDRRDVATLLRNLGLASGAGRASGDADRDGATGLADLAVAQSLLGESIAPSPAPAAASAADFIRVARRMRVAAADAAIADREPGDMAQATLRHLRLGRPVSLQADAETVDGTFAGGWAENGPSRNLALRSRLRRLHHEHDGGQTEPAPADVP